MVDVQNQLEQNDQPLDVSTHPDLRALAEAVQSTGSPRLLRVDGKIIAKIVPLTAPADGPTPESAPTLEMLRQQKAEILAIAENNGATDIRVFGSVARGTARPTSDIDFLVKLSPERTVRDLALLIVDLQDLLGYEVHVVEAQGDSPIAQRIHLEAVPL